MESDFEQMQIVATFTQYPGSQFILLLNRLEAF